MASVDHLLDALDRVGTEPRRPVSAHLDPALGEAAKAAVALGLTDSVSALTGAALHTELRRLALRAVLDEHYAKHPSDKPSAAEVALFLARARRLAAASDEAKLFGVLRGLERALGEDVDPETLLAAAVGHFALDDSAA
jgi:hypothetical protein